MKRNCPPRLACTQAKTLPTQFFRAYRCVSIMAIYMVLLVQELFFSRFTSHTSFPLIECISLTDWLNFFFQKLKLFCHVLSF